MSFALSDEATAHSLLALVALTKELDLPGSAPSSAAQHASGAIHVLRSRLESNPSLPEDALVGATAVLTIVEVSPLCHFRSGGGSVFVKSALYVDSALEYAG